jgi:hypothetical protein
MSVQTQAMIGGSIPAVNFGSAEDFSLVSSS